MQHLSERGANPIYIDPATSVWFRHERLDLSQRSIRLLEVSAELSTRGNVQCRLLHTTTDSKYQCLSYRWGPTDATQPYHTIEINGAKFPVLSNLWYFLRAFRQRIAKGDPNLPIWIDAISINQISTAERNHQVQQMSKIYGSAQNVIIWLGRGDADTEAALEQLEPADGDALAKTPSTWPNRSLIHRVVALSRNAYWTRLWVVQEVLLARRLDIMCGNARISWASWLTFHRQISDRRVERTPGRLMMYQREALSGQVGVLPLKVLLAGFKHSKCLDTRDRIFAFLGLCKEGVAGVIKADYNMDEGDLFCHIVASCYPTSLADGRMLARVLGIYGLAPQLREFEVTISDIKVESIELERALLPLCDGRCCTYCIRQWGPLYGRTGLSMKAKWLSKRRRQRQQNYLTTLPAAPSRYFLICLNEHGIQEHLLLLTNLNRPEEASLVGLVGFADFEDVPPTPQRVELMASHVRAYSGVQLTFDGDQYALKVNAPAYDRLLRGSWKDPDPGADFRGRRHKLGIRSVDLPAYSP